MAKTKIDKIERLRAEAAELSSRRLAAGRDAGRAWALDAGAGSLERLATAAGRFRTVPQYVSACACDQLGLPTRLYLDLYNASGASVEWEEVNEFWDSVLWGDGEDIRDRDVAAAFILAALSVWDEVKPGR